MLSQKELSLVRNSWFTVTADKEQFTDTFYRCLFKRDPELQGLFKRSMRMQGRKTINMLTSAIESLDDPDKLYPPLKAAGKRHIHYGVKDADYVIMRDAFIDTLRTILDEEIKQEHFEAWVTVFNKIAEAMWSHSTCLDDERYQFSSYFR